MWPHPYLTAGQAATNVPIYCTKNLIVQQRLFKNLFDNDRIFDFFSRGRYIFIRSVLNINPRKRAS